MEHNEDIAHKRRLLKIKKRRRRELELQAAPYGNDCPIHISMEIEDLTHDIEALRREIEKEEPHIPGMHCPTCSNLSLREISRETFIDLSETNREQQETEIINYRCDSCGDTVKLSVPKNKPDLINDKTTLEHTGRRNKVVGMAAVASALGVTAPVLARIILGDVEDEDEGSTVSSGILSTGSGGGVTVNGDEGGGESDDIGNGDSTDEGDANDTIDDDSGD